MFTQKRWAVIATFVLLAVVVLAACQPTVQEKIVEVTRVVTETVEVEGETVEVTRVVTETITEIVTPTSAPQVAEPKNLIVCMAQEPETLYQYGTNMLVKAAVLHGVYENLYTSLSYGYQAQGLEKLPSLADGDATIASVEIAAGDMFADKDGNVVAWGEGVVARASDGTEVTFDGNPVMVDQMTVNFNLRPWVWEDGTPVTADDSVYSFEVASDPDTPSSKFLVERTASYEATGDLTITWVGVPGWRDSTYFLNIWAPLPRHAWGSFTGAELVEAEESNRMPLSNGAFRIAEWVAGDHITLVKNENYYRASEGFPKVDTVTYKFIPDTNALVAQLLAGQCDIGTQDGMDVGQSPFLIESESQGLLVPYFQTGTTFEHIDFGVNSVDEYAATRPDWFEDARVRQAMTMCTDRQGMVDNIFYGRSEVIHTYIPSVHPLYADGLTEWPYDPEAANALLDEVGYVDSDGDGVREYTDGTPFKVRLGTTAGNEMRQQLTQIFKENQAGCGVEVELYYLPASEGFADGPEGPVFGRKFDLAEFAWLTGVQPSCDLYITAQIPGDPELGFAGWGGSNDSGWSNADYDAVCQTALGSLPGTPEYSENHMEAQRIFSQEVPVLPLFLRLKVAAARPEVTDFGVDPTENSELYNLYTIGLGD